MPNLKAEINYKEYLKSVHWQDTRRRYWASGAEKRCHFCKGTNQLALHHKYGYRRMYEENQNHLVLLCRAHHTELHQLADWKLDYKSVYRAYMKINGRYKRKRRMQRKKKGQLL